MPLFGAAAYDVANERDDDIPFEEQLKALDNVVRAGKVRLQHRSRRCTRLSCSHASACMVSLNCVAAPTGYGFTP